MSVIILLVGVTNGIIKDYDTYNQHMVTKWYEYGIE